MASRSSDSIAGTVCENAMLSSLPDAVRAGLEPHLVPVRLARKQVLLRAGEAIRTVWFPCSAVVSLTGELETGQVLEVGFVGRDGLVGTAVVPGVVTMPCDAIVQIPGTALEMDAHLLRRETALSAALHLAIDRFAHVLLARSMHVGLCNRFHPVEQRCIRWLLCVHDLIRGRDLPVTHEQVATMLGVRRSTITRVIRALDRDGLVVERRGRVAIPDRDRLEAACCECYAVIRDVR
jgi:CRP-like cAMP-binding protein